MLRRFSMLMDRPYEALAGFGLVALLLLALPVSNNLVIGQADQIPFTLVADAAGSRLRDGGAQAVLPIHAGNAPTTATMRFRLPDTASDDELRWSIWVPMQPVDELWLEMPGWESPRYSFFHASASEGIFPGGFRIRLPEAVQGDVEITWHVKSRVNTVLFPVVMLDTTAIHTEQAVAVVASMLYSALFTLTLMTLVLYVAVHDRFFLAYFNLSLLALLSILAMNGHLYRMPFIGFFVWWELHGLWALILLFMAAWLRMLQFHVGFSPELHRLRRMLNVFSISIVALAAVLLVTWPWVGLFPRVVLSGIVMSVGAISVILLVDAVRRKVPMSIALLMLMTLTVGMTISLELVSNGTHYPAINLRYSFQACIVVGLITLAVGLLSRVGRYRLQRDADRLARRESELMMQRESSKANFASALQVNLRQTTSERLVPVAWALLLDYLLPLLPVNRAFVAGQDHNGKAVVLGRPRETTEDLLTHIQGRMPVLRRELSAGVPVQLLETENGVSSVEALLPLPGRGSAWGVLLFRRFGDRLFEDHEMTLASDFVRLTQDHVEWAVAAINLRTSAEQDVLIGALNRRSLDEQLVRCFQEADDEQRVLSVLFVDLDYFKEINDRFGHVAGDHCLKAVAATLRASLSDVDIFGRYGGEEFMVVLPDRSSGQAREVAESLRKAVEESSIHWRGHEIRLTVSIGVATQTSGENTPDATIHRADNALYAAKRAGRNCVQVASSDID